MKMDNLVGRPSLAAHGRAQRPAPPVIFACIGVHRRLIINRRYPPINLVKHGHVARVAAWPHSSFHRYVERGVYDPDWGADDNVRSLEMD